MFSSVAFWVWLYWVVFKGIGIHVPIPTWLTPQHFVRLTQHFAGTHLHSLVERGTVRVKCLAQEHNTMTPACTQTRTAAQTIRPLRLHPVFRKHRLKAFPTYLVRTSELKISQGIHTIIFTSSLVGTNLSSNSACSGGSSTKSHWSIKLPIVSVECWIRRRAITKWQVNS